MVLKVGSVLSESIIRRVVIRVVLSMGGLSERQTAIVSSFGELEQVLPWKKGPSFFGLGISIWFECLGRGINEC